MNLKENIQGMLQSETILKSYESMKSNNQNLNKAREYSAEATIHLSFKLAIPVNEYGTQKS